MKTSKPLSLLSSLLTALAVLSGSIAAPLLCRPFYYAHIGPMGLAEYVGLTPEQIRQAFDQVMDFCLGLRPDFAAGVLPWSQSGADHFADVRRLFLLDLWVLGLSLAGLLCLLIYSRFKRVRPYCFRGAAPAFGPPQGWPSSFWWWGGLAALDFDPGLCPLPRPLLPRQDQLAVRLSGGPGDPDPPRGILPQLRPAHPGPADAVVRRPDLRRPVGREAAETAGTGPLTDKKHPRLRFRYKAPPGMLLYLLLKANHRCPP